ncbi:MAG: sugar ABC transporter ATP-binding protein [Thermoleophilia bacterium]|nr:sugar ABC transporter ATP-binding protein [Thermoleophilia bacterium]
MTESILQVVSLSKQYPGVRALQDVDFDVRRGEVHALVGANGAGKSTLIEILAGALHADSGEIYLHGNHVVMNTPAQARGMGLAFVHQHVDLVPTMTAAENIVLGSDFPRSRAHLVDARKTEVAAKAVANELGITFDLGRLAAELDGVERRLVSFAHALYREAEIVFMDEPTAGLTAREVDALFLVIRRLVAKDVAVVYVSHRLYEIFDIADRATIFKDGQRVATVAVKDIDQAELIYLITGKRQTARVAPVARIHEGEPVLSVRNLHSVGMFSDISFDLFAGEVLGIAGLVGSGRTELLRTIFGADKRSGGEILVDGVSLKEGITNAVACGVALVPEDRHADGLIGTLSAGENTTLNSIPVIPIPGLPTIRSRLERLAATALAHRVGLGTVQLRRNVMLFSGGQQQRMLIARWIGSKAKIFMFDEPTAGIDVAAKQQVYDLIAELAAAGAGIIVVSSDFVDIVTTCSRAVVMRRGELVAEVGKDELSEEVLLHACYEG